MPALPSVRLHSRSPLVPSVVQTLKREAFLLIESCPVEADGDLYEDKDWRGRLYISVTDNPQIRWNVTAKVRAFGGLARCHPGLPLSRHSIAFANADMADLPFLFKEGTGVLFYERPRIDPTPGNLPTLTFGITLKFGEYASTRYAAGSPPGLVGPGGPAMETGESTTVPETPAEWAGHLVSLYYRTPGGETSRVLRITPRLPTLSEAVEYFDGLSFSTVDGANAWSPDDSMQFWVAVWPAVRGVGLPRSPFPPVGELWGEDTGINPAVGAGQPVFMAAYDHRSNGWIGEPIDGITPEEDEIPRLVWFTSGTATPGPFLYTRDPDSPSELRPWDHAGMPVAASYSWEDGWSGPSAELLRMHPLTLSYLNAFDWPLPV